VFDATEGIIILLLIIMIIVELSTIGIIHKLSNLQREMSVGDGVLVLVLAIHVIPYPNIAMFAIVILLSIYNYLSCSHDFA